MPRSAPTRQTKGVSLARKTSPSLSLCVFAALPVAHGLVLLWPGVRVVYLKHTWPSLLQA